MRPTTRVATALAPPALVALAMTWLTASGEWGRFGLFLLPSKIGTVTAFSDLATFTFMADCVRLGIDVTKCDPYGRPFAPYIEPPATVLSALGLGFQQTWAIGVALMLLYVATVAVISALIAKAWKGRLAELLGLLTILTLGAVSPPAMLVIERGQLDIVILFTLLVGLLLVAVQSRLLQLVGALLLVIGAVAKYFAIGVFMAFLARRRWSIAGLLSLAATVALIALNWSAFEGSRATSRSDVIATSRAMFGSSALLTTILVPDPLATEIDPTTVPGRLTLMAFGVAVLALFTIGWLIAFRHTAWSPASMSKREWNLLVGGTGTLLGTFLVGLSYDYRLVMLLLPIAGAILWRARGGSAAFSWLIVSLSVASLLTGASMVPNPDGWILPKAFVVLGDLCLTAVLAAGVALFIDAWVPARIPRTETSPQATATV